MCMIIERLHLSIRVKISEMLWNLRHELRLSATQALIHSPLYHEAYFQLEWLLPYVLSILHFLVLFS